MSLFLKALSINNLGIYFFDSPKAVPLYVLRRFGFPSEGFVGLLFSLLWRGQGFA